MYLQLAVYEIYRDSVWSKQSENTPVLLSRFALDPQHAHPSQLVDGWRVYMINYAETEYYLPSAATIAVFMQFESKDAGVDYNMTTVGSYQTIKFGKQFKQSKPNAFAALERSDFDHDDWEKLQAIPEKITWGIGSRTNKYIMEIYGTKVEPCEGRRNYETCELVLYKIEKIFVHVSPETQGRIENAIAAGHRGVPIPQEIVEAEKAHMENAKKQTSAF